MESDRIYYVAKGKSLEKILKFEESKKAAEKAADDYKKRIKAKSCYYRQTVGGGFEVVAFTFAKDAPNGWIPVKDCDGGFRPSAKTRAGKESLRDIQALRVDGLSLTDWVFDGGKMYWGRFERIGNKAIIITVPTAKPPEDAVPIKASQYWHMKESAQP